MADPTIHVRPAARDDRSRLGEMAGRLVRLHHAFDRQRFLDIEDVEDGYGRWLIREAARERALVLVAEWADGTLVGYLYGAFEDVSWEDLRGPCGYLHDVWVEEQARNAGVATRLVEHACAVFEERGAPRVILMTASRNASAHSLFRKLGFRDTMIEMTRELGAGSSSRVGTP
jgi:ribosomal protein S18 acetylase RimI-like enzyme